MNITREQLKVEQESCYRSNITPIMKEIKDLKADIKDLGHDFNDFKTELKEIIAVIPYQVHDKTMKASDKKYATKLTQTLVYALVAIVLSAVIGGLVALVLK